MKREVNYILTEEQATCVGDIKHSKDSLERVLENIDKLSKEEIKNLVLNAKNNLSAALSKLELE